MGISFEENLKKAQAEALKNATLSMATTPAMPMDDMAVGDMCYGIATVDNVAGAVAAYDGWMKPSNSGIYEYYDEYFDDRISTVDEGKNVILADNQINLTQEKNSQYIPFEIPRFYDGFDLSITEISIYWVNENGYGGVEIPVNVYYNSDKVSFGWLVDDDVTAIAGKIKFEIQASGKNSLGYDYLWKTKPSEGLNVLQALEIKKFIEPDDTWQESFVSRLSEKVVAAETAANEARALASQAQAAADEVRAIADGLNDGIEAEVQEVVDTQVSDLLNQRITEALVNYYLKTETYSRDEVDDIVANIDISDQLEELKNQIDNIDGLAAFNAEYIDGALIFYNGETVIKSIAIPTADYLNQITEKITQNEQNIKENSDNFANHTAEVNGRFTVIENDLKSVHESIDGLPETLQIDYYTKEQTYGKEEIYNRDEVDEQLANVQVDLTGYATETFVTDKETTLTVSINANKSDISSISNTIIEMQEDINSFDTSPRKTYDITYNDLEDENGGENVLVFYEIENEKTEQEVRTVKQKYTIKGGTGGGTASSNTFYIYYDKDENGVNVTQYIYTAESIANKEAKIYYDFVGTDTVGDVVSSGNAVWQMRKGSSGAWTTIKSEIAYPGTDIEFNASEYISSTGLYSFRLNLSDETGAFATKTWSVQHVDLRIESNFNDKSTYPLGEISFSYTPYGSVPKDIHFILDGEEIGVVTTTASGLPMAYSLPAKEHGAHLLEVYMTATIQKNDVTSNHIFKDILWFDESASTPVIGTTYQTFTARQYEATNIEYTVHHPNTETPSVEIAVDGNIVSTTVLSKATNVYAFKTDIVGEHIITITCDGVTKRLIANVEKLNINVAPVTAGLAFDFNPIGKSNNDVDRLWSDGTVSMTVSDSFDWVNGGYQFDENGDQYFCIKAGTTAMIDYNLFADDPRKNGKEFKVVFRTKNIRKRDTTFLSCMDQGVGLDMKVEYASVYSSDGVLKSYYCENEIIEYEFNINKDEDMMIVMTYEDGTPNIPYEYKSTSSFKQTSPQPITIGSKDCDIHIYRMKAYSTSLTDVGIKNNFIADARSADEMIARYNRNQIYNEDGVLISTSANGGFSAEALMEVAPDLRYIFLEVPQFTNDKDNKISGCKVYFRYPNGKRPQDNWDCTGVTHRGQGTSSNLYGYSGRNIDLCMDEDESLFTYTNDNGDIVESSTITLTDTSVPTDYLNIKVNIASSENANNAGMARRFNEYQPFLRYARKKDSKVKDTMEFYNCVVFIRETNEDISVSHREFNDTNWHFYAIGNVGDSKKTDDTRVNNKRDPKEHVIEITDADKPLCAFPTGKDNNAICPESEWTAGNTAYDILYSTEYVYDEKGKFKSFGGKTYEFRYEMKNITEEQREVNINTWRELYKFIATSSDEEFHANLKKYFVVDSALYYYLFTERYTMVDNRAKNSFWHYGKVYISNEEAATLGETEASYYIIDDEQAAFADGYRYDLTFGYDFDTCLGIDNTGKMAFSYGKEDTDYYVDGDPSSDYVFRAADSVFFCRLRDLFPAEMQAMFKNREEKNAWDSNALIKQWDDSQSLFPEELWRLDYERKYYRTYLGLSVDNSIAQGADKTFLTEKFYGRKKYSRRQFEINQGVYMATKYFGNQALSDVFWMRGNVPQGAAIKPNYSLTLVPYSDMYVCVQYTSTGTPIHQKVKAGETCYFENDAERMDFIYVYAASNIQEVGDLSRCYIGDNNFSSATRLQKLVIGSTDDGYENAFMEKVLVENNPLLEHLDLRNISGINTVIDVSSCSNLKELYAEGTNASGVIFANGGLLETAHLPKLTSLSMKNLNYVKDFVVDGYDNLQTLIVENTPSINTYDIVTNAPKLQLLRLINLNWDFTPQISDSTIFDRLLTIGGIDSSGYEIDLSVLSGIASISVIGQYDLYRYQEAWKDLTINPTTVKPQFKVTFVNHDGTVLDTQYVEQFKDAVDPITREENPIPTPTKNSTIQYNYTFAGWDGFLTNIVADRTITATYTESLREYTVQYVSKDVIVKSATGLYGDNIVYDGDTPVYTAEEPYAFYLFNRWDKSGFLDNNIDGNGVKTVNAIFDKFEYTATSFDGRNLSDLTPVEIYALTKLRQHYGVVDGTDIGIEFIQSIIDLGDSYEFTVGNDVDYDDIESMVIVEDYVGFDGTSTKFDGTRAWDTGLKLFDVNRDFVLAIDYELLGGESDAILSQCYQMNGSIGFKLGYNGSNVQMSWGTSSTGVASAGQREMIVIRHKAGDKNIMIYNSSLNSDNVSESELYGTERMNCEATLMFGAGKADDGAYFGKAIGNINWCKIWYKDLGDGVCRDLAMWIHENIKLSVCGNKLYALSDNPSQRCTITLLADNLLEREMTWSGGNSNAGGWASSSLNRKLNSRLYNAIPLQIRSLIKSVRIPSSAGNQSTEILYPDCYISIPSLRELFADSAAKGTAYDVTVAPYSSEGKLIEYMTTSSARMRADRHGVFKSYWTRSPDVRYANYVWHIDDSGYANTYKYPTSLFGVSIMISI